MYYKDRRTCEKAILANKVQVVNYEDGNVTCLFTHYNTNCVLTYILLATLSEPREALRQLTYF